jgi:hypothetical protein
MNLAVSFAPLAALRASRKAWSHAVRVTAIVALFGALLAAGFQHRRDLADVLRTTFVKSNSKSLGSRVSAARTGEAQVLRPLDPASGFAETPVGVMLHSSLDTDTCRRVLFDNRTGLAYDDGHGHCGLQPTPPPEHLGVERIQAMSKAFRR